MKKLLYTLPGILALLVLAGLVVYRHMNPAWSLTQKPSNDKSLTEYFEEAAGYNTKPEPATVTFLAVGDISLSRGIALAIQKSNDPLLPFKGLDELLRSTDFNFGNLETPFSSSDKFTAAETLVFNAPKANVTGLKEYNFTVLNLANNHALDQGLDGVTTTAKVLDENGLLHMGTGQTLDEAWQPVIIEKNGIKIGFIGASYASINDGGKNINDHVARIEDTDRLRSNVKGLKSNVDFVVVTMHAGTEYVQKPTQSQIDFAHAAIDAGADIVIGAHSHWVQEKELYCPDGTSERALPKTSGEFIRSQFVDSHEFADLHRTDCKPIYYGLGNFIFDQSWSEETKKGLALKITLSKNTNQSTHSGSSPNIGEAGRGITDAATLQDLQPAPQVRRSFSEGGNPSTTIKSIQELPIYIQNNCCPTINTKQ